jgi:Holliday junction DNA helicase RuvB
MLTMTQQEYDKAIQNGDILPLQNNNKINTQINKLIIEEKPIDYSNLKGSKHKNIGKKPLDFSEYIGQENAKNILSAIIKNVKITKQTFPHTLIYGKSGLGKTSLTKATVNQLNQKMVECVASSLKSPQDFIDLIVESNHGIIYLDEVHTIDLKVAEWILPVIEDFNIDGKKIKPFTVIASTTNKGDLLKKVSPFVNRFIIQIQLEEYKTQEIELMIKNYARKYHYDIQIEDSIFNQLAKNSKQNPRTAISLFTWFIFLKDIKKVFKSQNIIYKGFNTKDLNLLEFLSKQEKPQSERTLATILDMLPNNYLYEHEDYMVNKQLIVKTPRGRIISDKGRELLTILQEKVT